MSVLELVRIQPHLATISYVCSVNPLADDSPKIYPVNTELDVTIRGSWMWVHIVLTPTYVLIITREGSCTR